jgi:hypothetical protein
MRWPSCHALPLSFLAQVDLGELRAAAPGATRARGTLWVFASLHELRGGITQIELASGLIRPGGCVAVRHRRAEPARPRATAAHGGRTLAWAAAGRFDRNYRG